MGFVLLLVLGTFAYLSYRVILICQGVVSILYHFNTKEYIVGKLF
jgi:hypothetical protein